MKKVGCVCVKKKQRKNHFQKGVTWKHCNIANSVPVFGLLGAKPHEMHLWCLKVSL